MSKRLFPALLAIAFTVLSGCGKTGKPVDATPDVVALTPGFPVDVGGYPVPVYGYSPCPGRDYSNVRFFGPMETDGTATCTVFDRDTKAVKVRLAFDDAEKIETWTVAFGKKRFHLYRPDGSEVRPYMRVPAPSVKH